VNDLVRDGLDQCQAAVRKLSNKLLYQQHEDSVQSGERKLEARGFQLDAVGEAVQELVKTVLGLIRRGDKTVGDIVDEAGFNGDDGDSDGWASPSSRSPVRNETSESRDRSFFQPVGDFDPHTYASRKRKATKSRASTSRGRRSQATSYNKRGRNRRKESSSALIGAESSRTNNQASRRRRFSEERSRPGVDIDRENRTAHDDNRVFAPMADADSNDSSSSSRNENQFSPAVRTFTADVESHPHAESENYRGRGARQASGAGKLDGALVIKGSLDNVSHRRRKRKQRSGTRTEKPSLDCSRFAGDIDHHGEITYKDRGVRPDSEDAISRMERFLEANKDITLEGTSPDLRSDVQKFSRKRRRHGQPSSSGRTRNANRLVCASLAEKTRFEEAATLGNLRQILFSTLGSMQSVERLVCEESRESLALNLSELCSLLAEKFPDASCVQTLSDIASKLRKAAQDSGENGAVAFRTFIEVLNFHGSPTLLALISRESPSLKAHVHLLATAIRMMHVGLNSRLVESDGVSYRIFSQRRCRRFAGLILLQLVDAVYALLHPRAYALQTENSGRILDILEPLRCSLLTYMNLSEEACRCVLNELQKQRWHLTSDGQHAYVSSVDPIAWSAFLATGEPPRTVAIDDIRLSAFKNCFPRCEIDAVRSCCYRLCDK